MKCTSPALPTGGPGSEKTHTLLASMKMKFLLSYSLYLKMAKQKHSMVRGYPVQCTGALPLALEKPKLVPQAIKYRQETSRNVAWLRVQRARPRLLSATSLKENLGKSVQVFGLYFALPRMDIQASHKVYGFCQT